ncbi:ATP-binding protein [Streptomyces griseomycini]|uniref:ATP-binding protein n=1 Tax=Streptomyces griseomycini TaxID=66895 RepID=UPI00342EB8A4
MKAPTIDRIPAQPHNSGPSSRLPLNHTQHAVRTARHHAEAVLTSWDISQTVVEDAVLVISELVTNACLHTPNGPAELHLLVQDQRLVIAVADTCADSIERAVPCDDSDDDHGRGLAVVRALAYAFGCHRTIDGKTVWAQISTQAQNG